MKKIISKEAAAVKAAYPFKVSVGAHGFSAGYCGGGNPAPPPRDEISGWSVSSSQRFAACLKSMSPPVDCVGYALTLTLRDIPETGAGFHRVLRAFIKRLTRMDAVCWQWLIEWQQRGAPHIHGCVFFHASKLNNAPNLPDIIKRHWLAVAGDYSPRYFAQTCKRIKGLFGWLEYQLKHSIRGVKHYQRAAANMPDGWRGKSSGRMWGHGGAWIIQTDESLITRAVYHSLRRLSRLWSLSAARDELPRVSVAAAAYQYRLPFDSAPLSKARHFTRVSFAGCETAYDSEIISVFIRRRNGRVSHSLLPRGWYHRAIKEARRIKTARRLGLDAATELPREQLALGFRHINAVDNIKHFRRLLSRVPAAVRSRGVENVKRFSTARGLSGICPEWFGARLLDAARVVSTKQQRAK